MLSLKHLKLLLCKKQLSNLPKGKLLINTINAHSYNTAQKDSSFAQALTNGDVLLPDGASIVKACKWVGAQHQPSERVAGYDLFEFEMQQLNQRGGKCMFLGSSPKTLKLIENKSKETYPNIEIITFSPPYATEFTPTQSSEMIAAVNAADPDLLWIGMTAPKQEKWTFEHWNELNIKCHVGTIGAVFDFFAGTVKRAPLWWQSHSLEWLYRLLKEPRRMWRRYIIGNVVFMYYIAREKIAK